MLVVNNLSSELEKIFDQESSNFLGFPQSLPEAADRWTEAWDNYAKKVMPPSTTTDIAKETFRNTFLGINNYNGLVQFPLCFFNYAVALAPGMLPTFSGTPPPTPPVLAPVWAVGYGGGGSSECIKTLSSILDSWMKTGIATNIITGVSIPWS